jgi:SAM-dependent methyltransferase
MEEKTLSSNYGEYYEKSTVFPQQLDQVELNQFIAMLPAGNLEVLDLGCAEGLLAVGLAQKGHAVSIADIAPSQLTLAQAQADRAGVKVSGSYLCNIEESIQPFGDKKFDVIFFMDVIEHLKNPIRGLELIRTLLKENGTLILHTPNASTIHRLLWHMVKRGPVMDYYDPNKLQDFHFLTYDYLTLEKTLNFIGLKINKVEPTRITIPRLFVSRFLARLFPLLSDTLLVTCHKVKPIDLDSHIAHWTQSKLTDSSRPLK